MDRLLPPATNPHRHFSSNLLTLCSLVLMGVILYLTVAAAATPPAVAVADVQIITVSLTRFTVASRAGPAGSTSATPPPQPTPAPSRTSS